MPSEQPATVQRAIAGDSAALDAVWREHRPWLAVVVLAYMPVEADLEDVLQEVAVAVVETIHTIRDPDAIRPWLRGVARNVARTVGRRATIARRNGAALARLGPEGRNGHPPPPDSGGDDVHALLRLVQSLPRGHREPLLLRAVQGLSHRQIADLLELPVRTVETRLRRARLLLRELGDTPPTSPPDTDRTTERADP